MKVTLIGTNITMQKGDFFGTGIPYFPLVVIYTASYLKEKGHIINFIDAFGENPFQVQEEGNKFIQGLTPEQVVQKIDKDTQLICIGAERVIAHNSILKIIASVQQSHALKNVPIVILENTQAVTAYSLSKVTEDFLKHNFLYILTGEPEHRVEKLIKALEEKNIDAQEKLLYHIDGIIYKNKRGDIFKKERTEVIQNLDSLPFPAWDLLNLEHYWQLGYAHGPLTSKKYLPLLTSRGCPYQCTFCVTPATNKNMWRSRSAKNVVDEIELYTQKFGVFEYHIEDLNPTIKKERIVEIAKEIMQRNLKISWKISSGTKVETLDEETIQWMAQSGCTYISISPESGSSKILKLMKKPFSHVRALELVKEMNKNNITTQACFILGYPQEQEDDIIETNKYVKKLVQAGIDEIAVLILTPVPGSAIFNEYYNFNERIDVTTLTFTPMWRKDYSKYDKERKKTYIRFFLWRCIYYPQNILASLFHLITKKFETKMEMTLYRVFKVWMMCKFYK